MTTKVLSDTEVSLKCVDANEVIYDEKEKYLHKTSSTKLNSKEELFREIVTNIEKCQDVCWNLLRQLVIIKEPRVRFKSHSDVSGLQQKIEETSLSLEVKTYFRDAAKAGYKILRDAGLLNNLVEFEVERHATVDLFGKKLQKVVANMDMVSLIENDTAERIKAENDELNQRFHLEKATKSLDKKAVDQKHDTNKETQKPDKKALFQKENTKEDVKKKTVVQKEHGGATAKQDLKKKPRTIHRKPSKLPEFSREDTKFTILDIDDEKEEKKSEESRDTKEQMSKDMKLSKFQRQKEVLDIEDTLQNYDQYSREKELKDTFSVWEIPEESKEITKDIYNRAIVTFLLTPRISVNAVQVFRQLLFLHMLPRSTSYLLVCHIGPLNEDQEIVLYKFKPNETLIDACKADDNNILDLHKLEKTFRAVTGQRLQKLADFKEYFKYYIYDCPGVKDHAKDNIDRLERYLKKKKEKRDRKKQEKENSEESESEFGSELARAWSPKSDTESWATLSELNESDIMSAADLQNYMEEFK